VQQVIMNQTSAAFRHNIAYCALDHYKSRFRLISAKRASQILFDLGCGDDNFYWFGISGKPYKWTAAKILKQEDPDSPARAIGSWYASIVTPVTFVGGPPSKWGTYKGTLLTFLLDRIAAAILLGGMKAVDQIIIPTESYPKYA
jgi:hypothetical protein